jgi:hypothetical protein
MKTAHDTSPAIRQGRVRIAARNPASLAEFHPGVMGMHQEIELNKMGAAADRFLKQSTLSSKGIRIFSSQPR